MAVNAQRALPSWQDGTIVRVLTSVDHKRVGLLYLATAFVYSLSLGLSALLLALDLDHAPFGLLSGFAHFQLNTLQGTVALFLVGLPTAIGLVVFLVPIMVGSRGIAFPRLNAFAFWLYLAGATLMLASFAAGNAEQSSIGAPLSDQGRQLWVLGLLLVSVGGACAAVPVLATIRSLRAPGMTADRLPVFVWGSALFGLVLVLTGVFITIVSAVFLVDAGSADAFPFDAVVTESGVAGFYQNGVWFFGHPLMYALFLPVLGAVSEVIPVFTRRPLKPRVLALLGLAGIAVLALLVGLYHLVADGFSGSFPRSLPLAGFVVLVPIALVALTWLSALRGAPRESRAPLALSLAMLELLVVGTVLGLVFGFPGDYKDPSSYHVSALFQGTLAGALLLGGLAALHYWFPKLTGRQLDRRIENATVFLVVAGANALLVGQHVAGESNVERLAPSADWSSGAKVGAGIALAGFLLLFFGGASFLANVVKSAAAGRRASGDPWQGDTLEWYVASPPAPGNFGELPRVTSERPLHDIRVRLPRS